MSVCPCTIVEPCRSTCSCANSVMSGGCRRCATYGSPEQMVEAATDIARRLDLKPPAPPPLSFKLSHEVIGKIADANQKLARKSLIKASPTFAYQVHQLALEVMYLRGYLAGVTTEDPVPK